MNDNDAIDAISLMMYHNPQQKVLVTDEKQLSTGSFRAKSFVS